LYMALNRHHDATLLWVVPAERDRPPGTVEVLMPGLLRGYIDRFAPGDNAHDLSFDGWLRVCTNAVALTKLWRPMVSDIDPRPNAANDDGLGPGAGPGKAPAPGKAPSPGKAPAPGKVQ
jgi:hypothetical protein